MKILGFEVSKKVAIGGAVVILLVVGVSAFRSYQEKVEFERRQAEEQARIEAQQKLTEQNSQGGLVSVEDQMQASLVEQYGEAPEGFKWDVLGNLVATSSDDKSAEEVLDIYIRSISIQDFASAQRYSATSKIYETYTDYFSDIDTGVTDYYEQFLRKQYSFAMKSIENLGVEGVATLADGTQVMTVKLRVLDLTDKDFWRKDMAEIYGKMREFAENEADDAKKEQYLYDYIYKKYEDGTIGKREVTIDFKVGKQKQGGWLISDDRELNAYLSYENGTDVASYIMSTYEDWLLETTLEEQEKLLQEELKKGGR